MQVIVSDSALWSVNVFTILILYPWQLCNATTRYCGLLINVSDTDQETPSSHMYSTADMLYSGGEHLSNCSAVDGLSADILQV